MSQTHVAPAAVSGSPAAPRRWWPFAWLAAGLAAFVVVAALPWEWSFIDDTGAVATLHAQQDLHGVVGGVFGAMAVAYRVDLTWGLFRPAYWLYTGVFYLLPPGPAHAVRLVMLAAAATGPLVVVARSVAPPVAARPVAPPRRQVLLWTGAALAANPSLYRGLWYDSLQELSGVCFVGLGLATRRPWLRLAAFVVAAWFKAPFAWLLVGYGGLLLLRRGSRWWGAASALLGAGTLVTAAQFARSGSYTAGLGFGADRLLTDVRTAGVELAPVAVVLLAGAVALRARPRWPEDPIGPGLLLGGLGYLANLLPWQTGVHYAGPYVYLIGTGAVLALAPTVATGSARRQRVLAAAGLALAVVVGLGALLDGGRYVYRNAATTTGLRDCLLALPDGALVGYNRPEAWDRLNAIVRLHRPATRTHVSLVWNGTMPTTGLGYYIWEPEYGPGTPALRSGPVVCRTPLATVYRTH